MPWVKGCISFIPFSYGLLPYRQDIWGSEMGRHSPRSQSKPVHGCIKPWCVHASSTESLEGDKGFPGGSWEEQKMA